MTATPLNSTNPSRTVVVDDPEDPLSFHDPKQLATTIDMAEITEAEARANGAVGCSDCFDDVDMTAYRFPYLDSDLATLVTHD